MSRTPDSDAETSLEQSVSDLVAEGGHPLPADDKTTSSVETPVAESTPTAPPPADAPKP